MVCLENRRIKKVFALWIVLCLLAGSGAKADAATGYATKSMKGSNTYTQFNCSLYRVNNFWDVEVHADGTSQTLWCGSTPFYADSITHNNILSCTGIGSMSVGGNKSGANFSASVSGHSATWSYSLKNVYHITVDYKYYTKGLLGAWNMKMRTEATIQFGSNFYTFGT